MRWDAAARSEIPRRRPAGWALATAGAFTALIVALGCGTSDRAADPSVELAPIQVDSVEVLVQESSPPRASARVRGVVGDGCSSVHSVEQERSGATVTLAILRARPVDAFCTQIALLYDETIPLEGSFPPGRYVLKVNDREVAFTTQ